MAKRRLFQFPVKWVTEENVHQVITGDATFGQKPDRFHRGADIGENAGEAIYPIAAGTVYDFGYDDEAGNYVIIQHDEASYSYYLHMMGRSNYDVGQPVGLNDVIGYVGSTGWSTGAHIHFAVSGVPNWSGWVDPVQYVLDRYWYDDGQPDYTSHLNAVQQDQLAGWIGQAYGARQYWSDVQAIARDRGWYPEPYQIDGIPGAQTYVVEQQLWEAEFNAPAPEPVTPDPETPAEPEIPVVPDPSPGDGDPEPEPEPTIPEEPIPAPTPKPISEEAAVTVTNLIQTPDLEQGALGAVVEDPGTRKRLYAWYVIVALVAGALVTGTVAGVAAAATIATIGLAPFLATWIIVLAILVGVIGYLGPYAAVLASANTPKKG